MVIYLTFFDMQLPREKITQIGPSNMENHELLSIILGRGSTKEDVFTISKRIFTGFDYQAILHQQDIKQLQKELKIGFVQACQLASAIEFGKRFFKQPRDQKQITTINDAYEIFKPMQYLKKEHVRGLYLNSRYRIIHNEIISIGSLDGNILHPREVFRPAIEYGAYALILAHNHPSGSPNPSTADIEITAKLRKSGEMLQIPLLEHLVIGEGAYGRIIGHGN